MSLPLAFASVLLAQAVRPQPGPTQPPPRPTRPAEKPLPSGDRIEVHDGDTIVLEPGVRVRTIKRHRGDARIVWDATKRWLIVLVDEEPAPGVAPDGEVDMAYVFRDVEGKWPLEPRWDVYPEQAQKAGIAGVVILEITIGTDGAVTDAKVLRSLPMLGEAALDCVKQWRYTPTLLNGNPVPVVMTVTVEFAPR